MDSSAHVAWVMLQKPQEQCCSDLFYVMLQCYPVVRQWRSSATFANQAGKLPPSSGSACLMVFHIYVARTTLVWAINQQRFFLFFFGLFLLTIIYLIAFRSITKQAGGLAGGGFVEPIYCSFFQFCHTQTLFLTLWKNVSQCNDQW